MRFDFHQARFQGRLARGGGLTFVAVPGTDEGAEHAVDRATEEQPDQAAEQPVGLGARETDKFYFSA
ncbi:hypothetical protein [Candidatus Accumulibacter phosphatis]|uniref:hypothetical protein n=1 Tax=Candidatus Accumulibacter phosphatis TaxID=327160 RepID=UPI00110AF6ED|nr:hypothetical protein [Candidatus Accumulibacter phosphatis]